MNAATAVPGDDIHTPVDGSTGQTDSSPANGSRMMPLAKLDAAAIGKMTDPAAYLGSAGPFVDRVLTRARSMGVS